MMCAPPTLPGPPLPLPITTTVHTTIVVCATPSSPSFSTACHVLQHLRHLLCSCNQVCLPAIVMLGALQGFRKVWGKWNARKQLRPLPASCHACQDGRWVHAPDVAGQALLPGCAQQRLLHVLRQVTPVGGQLGLQLAHEVLKALPLLLPAAATMLCILSMCIHVHITLIPIPLRLLLLLLLLRGWVRDGVRHTWWCVCEGRRVGGCSSIKCRCYLSSSPRRPCRTGCGGGVFRAVVSGGGRRGS
mmetsp:Transcript_16497/g.45236  ORF Transcript_16497/g.45236 Transcript_16497/m.45236 type:complete len:245 (+) Transcript_16497:467-1201(+)